MTHSAEDAVAMISSYVPRRCGIATFAHDLASALCEHVYRRPLADASAVAVVAMDDQPVGYDYGPEVLLRINQHRRAAYRNAADEINDSKVQTVLLQHEYGLFGGDWGDYLFELLDRLEKPLVTTLHTILTEPNPNQLRVLQRLCQRSDRVVVMADKAREILRTVYSVPEESVCLIPHGVPDVALGDTEPFKRRFRLEGHPMILTFGLLSPNKSIETVLQALGKVVPDFPELVYVVLGITHPSVKREAGESYRISLERMVVELGIQKNVAFHNRYVSLDDLREYLLAADIYTTPYKEREQITSGTLAYAVAAGKAVVSTPYWHAQELLADGRGRLVEFGDVDGFAAAFRELLGGAAVRERIRRAAHELGREMIWPNVGRRYAAVLEEAVRAHEARRAAAAPEAKSLLRMSLPEVNLAHLITMTDDTGMLQHSVYSTPDRRHGYSTDDNARALVVCVTAWQLFQDERAKDLVRVYLAYLNYAQNQKTGRFRNFMAYDRRWLEQDGSDDCQGRVLWALGHLIAHAPDPSTRELAEIMFRASVPSFEFVSSPRTWTFAILGLHYYLRVHEGESTAQNMFTSLVDRLDALVAKHEQPDWLWPEEVATYENGRIPQALIIGGYVLGRRDTVHRGLRVLRWLLDVQTSPNGHISFIGNDGWFRRGSERPRFDQQPLEAAALIGACKAAYRASGDADWLVEMRRCFEWYLGRNELDATMIDFRTGGCFDGLTPDGVNRNQGAESVVSWLLSLLIMHEMQTGDPPTVA